MNPHAEMALALLLAGPNTRFRGKIDAMVRSAKPRICLEFSSEQSGRPYWCCAIRHIDVQGWGATPQEAYKNWQRRIDRGEGM